jgi:hypothetical protein|tara:strand:- start:879 stop:1175 length:297 start_codon:yes stop_codon:yes gene_type:complete
MTGTTPFERSDALRAEGERRITTAYATSQLVKVLQECDTMIELWHSASALYIKYPTESNKIEMEITLSIATEALKEKKSTEAALVQVAMLAEELGMVE